MFEIGQILIHKGSGACKVKSIVQRDFGSGSVDYYCFVPVFPSAVNANLEIYLPVEKATNLVRNPASKDKVMDLIYAIPSLEVMWYQDAKFRKQKFEEIFKLGDLKLNVQLVKLLYVEKEFLSKPLSLTDKTFLNKVKKNVFDEFSVALGLTPDDIEDFVNKSLNEEK